MIDVNQPFADPSGEQLDHKPLAFGKYKGKTPSHIAEIDESYIVWLYENVKPKQCSRVLYEDCLSDEDDPEIEG